MFGAFTATICCWYSLGKRDSLYAATLSGSHPFGMASLVDKQLEHKSVCKEDDSVLMLTKDPKSSNMFDVLALEFLLDGDVDTSSSEREGKRRDCNAEDVLLFLNDWLYDVCLFV